MKWMNDEVERRLLGSVLLNKDSWHSVQERFSSKVFSDPDLKDVAEVIEDIAKTGKAPSATRVYLECRKRGIEIRSLTDLADSVVTTQETEDLNDQLFDLWRKRTTLQKLQEAVYEIERGDGSTDDIIARAQDALLSAFDEEKSEVVDWSQVIEEVHEQQVKAQNGEVDEGVPVGLEAIAKLLGKLVKKRLYLIAARPSMGKSAMTMNIIKAVIKQSRRALLFTPEQANQEFAVRSLSAELDIPIHFFGEKMDKYFFDKFNDGITNTFEWKFKMVDRSKPTIGKIKAIARAEKARNPDLDLIAVDYIGECNIESRKNGGNDNSATGHFVSELRGLGKELDVAMVVVSQLNRMLESRPDKRPIMADLRDSGRLEEVADTIMFLYRHGYYYENFMGTDDVPCTYGDEITEIKVAKDRQGGASGKKALARFNMANMRFEKLEKKWVEKYIQRINA